ncbi:MAG: reverse transcriptase domain-containing protein [Candidatus Marinamargulisbacteria bacterium]
MIGEIAVDKSDNTQAQGSVCEWVKVVMDSFWEVRHARRFTWHNNDIWSTAFNWPKKIHGLVNRLLAGTYRMEPARLVRINKYPIRYLSGVDQVVARAVLAMIKPVVTAMVSPICVHVAGRGGLKEAVRQAQDGCREYKYVMKSDVDSFYENVDHNIVIDQCQRAGVSPFLCGLLKQLLTPLVDDGGQLTLVTKGLCKGSPLSPLLGALYLRKLDRVLSNYAERHRGQVVRYMDDFIFFCDQRWVLRRVVRATHGILSELGMRMHPQKTTIGKVATWLTFCGYELHPTKGIRVAKATYARYVTRVRGLYEQGVSQADIRTYHRRWWGWAKGGGVDLV